MSRAQITIVVAAGVIALCLGARVDAQPARAAAPPAPPPAPRAAAPIDLTGYWVSIVTQDWRWRMVTPAQRRLPAPAADARRHKRRRRVGSGEGRSRRRAVPILRRTRLDERPGTAAHHLAGRQHAEGRDGRGHADAALALRRRQNARRTRRGRGRASRSRSGRRRVRNVPLHLPTGRAHRRTHRPSSRPADRCASSPTNLRAGYLRKNGVPYSENAVLTEHWDLYKRPNGEEWLTITTVRSMIRSTFARRGSSRRCSRKSRTAPSGIRRRARRHGSSYSA